MKSHPFFRGVDWQAVYEKRAGKGPIIPRVEWAGDAGNFDEYPDPPPPDPDGRDGYGGEVREWYEESFRDF